MCGEGEDNILVMHEALEAALGLAALEICDDEALLHVQIAAEDVKDVWQCQGVLGYRRRVEREDGSGAGGHSGSGSYGGGGADALFLVAAVVAAVPMAVVVAVVVLRGGGGAAPG